jgi:UDP-N-acetylglucosamine--N-acetylmuramyl-(pentapeptide) pyrophosphoryl-undecaprenol N-acetylglucosamine transferase
MPSSASRNQPADGRPHDPVIHLACSRGGHLDVLLRHRGAFDGYRIVWVTQNSARADRLRLEGAEVNTVGEWHGPLSLAAARTVWRSFRLLVRERPRVIVTSGSGIVVPFCLMARLAGARIVFIETTARVNGPSSSGRVLSRLAEHVIAQWDEMRAVYRNATIARASILDGLRTEPPTEGTGTFVAVGTHSQPFDRLLRAVDRAAAAGILPAPVTAQVGPSTQRLRDANAVDLLTPQEIEDGVRRSRYVVCHAGSGMIATALRTGRRPLVMARLQRHGEHFDDHQQQIVNKLAAFDLVVPVGDKIMESDVARAERPLCLPAELARLPLLVDCVAERVHGMLGSPRVAEALVS